MISIYVGNLPYDTTEAQLVELFGQHGEVHRASLVTDRETGRPRGFGFVEMPTRDEALRAIEALGGTDFNGRPLTVNEARRNTSRNTANLSRSAKSASHPSDEPGESHGSSGYAAKPSAPEPASADAEEPQPSAEADNAADRAESGEPPPDKDNDDTPAAGGYSNDMGKQ